MARQKKIVARAHKARIGSDVSLLVDGPSAEHEMVLQGRLEGQAPDIDSVVYLTDCDPTGFEAGALIRARIVGAQGLRPGRRSAVAVLVQRSSHRPGEDSLQPG